MKSTKLIALALVASPVLAFADTASDWSFSGTLDVYYAHDFNKPASSAAGFSRNYDVLNNQFSLAAATVKIVKAPAAGQKVGATLELITGKNAEINNASEPAGTETYKLINQAYATYNGGKYTVDLGKFSSWIGYESSDSTQDDLYSRGFLFTFDQPVYHTGLRVTGSQGTSAWGLYAVNGWNEVQDSNNHQSYGASYSINPNTKTGLTLNYYGGIEGPLGSGKSGFGGPESKVSLFDAIATYQATSSVKLAVNYDNARLSKVSTSQTGKFDGWAFYVKDSLKSGDAVNLRFETLKDDQGIREDGGSLNSYTLGYDHMLDKSATLRFEYRYDKASVSDWFPDDNTGTDKKTTFTVALGVKF